jgi:signal peptidase I
MKKGLKFFGIGLLFVICLRIFIGEHCIVPSDSMYPTILAGDRLWMDYATYGARLPRRFADIPLLNAFTWIGPLRRADERWDWGEHRMPGRRMPQTGDMVVFDSPEVPYLLLVKRIAEIKNIGDTIHVGDSVIVCEQPYYKMLGDNSKNSHDSRYFGYIPYSSVKGRIKIVLYSIDPDKPFYKAFRWGSLLRWLR